MNRRHRYNSGFGECIHRLNHCRRNDDDCNEGLYNEFFGFICNKFYYNNKVLSTLCCEPKEKNRLKDDGMCDLIAMITNQGENKSLAFLIECHKYDVNKDNRIVIKREIKELLNSYPIGLEMLVTSPKRVENVCRKVMKKISQRVLNLTHKEASLNKCIDFLENNPDIFNNYNEEQLVKCGIFGFKNRNELFKSIYGDLFNILEKYLKLS